MNKREWARVYGSRERCRWISEQPSVASGRGPCVNAHVTPNDDPPSGMGRKPDARWIVPLTYLEHLELHASGTQTFQAYYGINLVGKAREIDRQWRLLNGEVE